MASGNRFNTVLVKPPQDSTFDLSHDVKLTCNMGQLVPVYVQEVIPGDRYKISNECLTRFMPLISPVMHRFKLYTHYFFVPNRIVWNDFQYWIFGVEKTEGQEYIPPTIEVLEDGKPKIQESSLWDYMGLVPNKTYLSAQNCDINAIPFAAYQMIWYQWYRDQNLQEADTKPSLYELEEGVMQVNSTTGVANKFVQLRKRAWRHDYFTAALLEPQKGPDVTIPFGEFVDVGVKSGEDGITALRWDLQGGGTPADGDAHWNGGIITDDLGGFTYPVEDDLIAKTSRLEVPAPTINELRMAFALQRWMEINARGGTRYVEGVKAHFDVQSSDARLNNPEFLGGNIANVVVSEVLQTAGPNSDPESGVVGGMAGHAITATEGNVINYYAEEHGFIIGILSILPVADYSQGIPRHFGQRKDRYDYLWPSLAHLGEQAILNKEIYYDEDIDSVENGVWGYIPRYSEYTYAQNRIAGAFRSSLDYWVYNRIFDQRPFLDAEFIEFSEDFRIFAVTDESEQHMLIHFHNMIWSNRRLPKYGTPI